MSGFNLFINKCNLNITNENCNQTLVEWSLDGPLPKLCPVITTSNQDGGQAKIEKSSEYEIVIFFTGHSVW
jgi:hypothetical protein